MYSYTSKFFQITSYLLMEYRYSDSPNPAIYPTNTGSETVGYDKMENGYTETIQIFNPLQDSSITNNTTRLSVVKISDSSYITLDPNLVNVPFNDFDDKLTNTNDLPVVFPNNLFPAYDSIRYHIRAGYNLNNIDGLIASLEYPDQNGKYVTMSQILIRKGSNEEYDFSPTPISIGSAIYDRYLEIKIPNLKDANDKYIASSDAGKPNTLAGKISQSGKGFIYGAPLRFILKEVQSIDTYNGYERYNTANLATLSIEQEDPFSNIGATIKESSQGQFFEYFATDNEGFVEDFILFQNSIGNSYFISHQIQTIEQIGASFIETSRFESIQTTAYDVPNYYRPIVRNAGVAASFTLRYTMSLVNNKDQSRVIRIGTYTSSNPSEWGTNITPIQLSNFPQVQKIYNKVYGQGMIQNSGKMSPLKIIERFKTINNIIQQNTVTTVFSNLSIKNESKSTTGSSDITAIGTGKLTVEVSPFDNLYKFKFIKSGSDGSPVDIDLTSFGVLRMSFLLEKGEKLNIRSFSDNTIANPSKGEILFKIDESNSLKILNLKDNRFFITSGLEDPDPSKSLDPQKAISKVTKASLRSGIKGKILERSNALNSIKETATNSTNSTVLYWGYWKSSGQDDVIPSLGKIDITTPEISPVLRRPINPPSKSPSRPSVNTVVPNSVLNPRSSTGSTGTTGGTQTQDLSSLSGSSLDNSVIAEIKKVFNDLSGTAPSSGPSLFSGSAINIGSGGGNDNSTYVNSLVDLYSKYPQLTKIKYLDLYSKATTNIPPYTALFINSIRLKVSSQIE